MDNGKEFDETFTETMLREEATSNNNKKRKRGIVNAYNDLRGVAQLSESDGDNENKQERIVYCV